MNTEKVKLIIRNFSLNLKRWWAIFSTTPTIKKLGVTLPLLFVLTFPLLHSVFFLKKTEFVNPNPSTSEVKPFSEASAGAFWAKEAKKGPPPKAVLERKGSLVASTKPKPATPESPPPPLGNTFSILLLGLDRRSKGEFPYRTDAIILATALEERKKVLLTSIPRDLWVKGRKINAIYTSLGLEELKKAVGDITGVAVDRFIDCDFDTFVWAINNFGGVEVKIERGFTDNRYPSDREGGGGFLSVTFGQGLRKLDGETALKYARSRYGSNNEGSDFARSLRQQNLLRSLPKTFLSGPPPFEPFSSQGLYDLAQRRGIKTDLTVDDIIKIYSMIKQYPAYEIQRFVLDYSFLYSPPLAQYGGAWVLLPRGGNYAAIQQEIRKRLQL